jgi:hypothetical protein
LSQTTAHRTTQKDQLHSGQPETKQSSHNLPASRHTRREGIHCFALLPRLPALAEQIVKGESNFMFESKV